MESCIIALYTRSPWSDEVTGRPAAVQFCVTIADGPVFWPHRVARQAATATRAEESSGRLSRHRASVPSRRPADRLNTCDGCARYSIRHLESPPPWNRTSASESFASSGGRSAVLLCGSLALSVVVPSPRAASRCPRTRPGHLALTLSIRVHRLVLDTTLHCAITWELSHSGNAIEWDQLQEYGVPRQNSGADATGFDLSSLSRWLGCVVVRALDLRLDGREFDSQLAAEAVTGMGDRLRACKPPHYFTKPPGPTQPLTLSQSAVMLCGWGVKAGMARCG